MNAYRKNSRRGYTRLPLIRDSIDFQLDPPKISSYQIIWGTPAYHFQGTVWMDFQLDCAVQNPLSMAEFCNLIK